MKKFQKNFYLLDLCVLFICVILACSWQKPVPKNSDIIFRYADQRDTVPNNENLNLNELDNSMKNLDLNMADLDVQLKNLNVDLDKKIEESLSKINFDEIQNQTEASLKQVDWDKIQKQVDNSLQHAQNEIAQIDFSKITLSAIVSK